MATTKSSANVDISKTKSTTVAATAVRGYHVFQVSWSPMVGDELVCKHERNNCHDAHAMGVYCEEKLVGHLPKEVSKYFHYINYSQGREYVCSQSRRGNLHKLSRK